MPAQGWSRAFADPIPLPGGGRLSTLLEAGSYIAGLPAAMQKRSEWQAAAEALLLVAERGGDTMLARIGVMRALTSGRPAPPVMRGRVARSSRIVR